MSLTDATLLRNDAKYERDEKGKFVGASAEPEAPAKLPLATSAAPANPDMTNLLRHLGIPPPATETRAVASGAFTESTASPPQSISRARTRRRMSSLLS